MATSVFQATDTAVGFGGPFATPVSFSGTTVTFRKTGGSPIVVIPVGTKARLGVYAQFGKPTTWTVDGSPGVGSPATPVGSTIEWLTLFDSLSDAPHVVEMTGDAFSGIDMVAFIEVTGSSPSLAPLVDYDYGNQYTVYAPSDVMQNNDNISGNGFTDDNSIASYIADPGSYLLRGRGTMRFKATIGSAGILDILSATQDGGTPHEGGGSKGMIGLCIDNNVGTDGSPILIGLPSTYPDFEWTRFSGLSPGEHEFRVCIGNFAYIYSVRVPGGSVSQASIDPYSRTIWISGDSLVAGSTIVHGDCLNFPFLLAVMARIGVQQKGQPGGTTTTALAASPPEDVAPGLSVPKPTDVVSLWGTNDASGSVTTTDYANNSVTMANQWLTDLSGTVGVCNVIDTPYNDPHLGPYNAALASALAGISNPRFRAIDTAPWGTSSDWSTYEGVHFDETANGAMRVALKLMQAMGFQASGGPFPFHMDSELCGGFADMGV